MTMSSEIETAAPGPSASCTASAATRSLPRMLSGGRHRVVGRVDDQVDHEDEDGAEDEAAGDRARRILDLAGGERQEVPAVVGPQHGDERHAEAEPGNPSDLAAPLPAPVPSGSTGASMLPRE